MSELSLFHHAGLANGATDDGRHFEPMSLPMFQPVQGNWAEGVDREILTSSSFMSADMSAKSGVLR
jgi:hypothetical protein